MALDPISGADRLARQLRLRLEEHAKRSRIAGSATGKPAAADPYAALRALAAAEGIDDQQVHRALIQSLLADQFGTEFINDAKFQQVISGVTETLEADPGGAKLLARITAQLRGQD